MSKRKFLSVVLMLSLVMSLGACRNPADERYSDAGSTDKSFAAEEEMEEGDNGAAAGEADDAEEDYTDELIKTEEGEEDEDGDDTDEEDASKLSEAELNSACEGEEINESSSETDRLNMASGGSSASKNSSSDSSAADSTNGSVKINVSSGSSHVHTWEPLTETVHHDAVEEEGHYRLPSDVSSYYIGGTRLSCTMVSTEGIYLYGGTDISVIGETGKYYKKVGSVTYDICRKCGFAVPLNADGDAWAQSLGYADAEEGFVLGHTFTCGYSWTVYSVPIVEEIEMVYVVDTPASDSYDETVTVGYKCSGCGTTVRFISN